jgi:hypothetical protein
MVLSGAKFGNTGRSCNLRGFLWLLQSSGMLRSYEETTNTWGSRWSYLILRILLPVLIAGTVGCDRILYFLRHTAQNLRNRLTDIPDAGFFYLTSATDIDCDSENNPVFTLRMCLDAAQRQVLRPVQLQINAAAMLSSLLRSSTSLLKSKAATACASPSPVAPYAARAMAGTAQSQTSAVRVFV